MECILRSRDTLRITEYLLSVKSDFPETWPMVLSNIMEH